MSHTIESRRKIGEAATKHGHNTRRGPSSTYGIWQAMKRRCQNPNAKYYELYGGRGICVDPRWNDFRAFLEDMGERPAGLQIDRVDTNGDYCKANCRWATSRQNNNNRRNNVLVPVNGAMVSVAQASRLCGVKAVTIYERLYQGDSPEDAVRPTEDKRVRINVSGELLTLAEMSARCGISASIIYNRLYRGSSPAEAMRSCAR